MKRILPAAILLEFLPLIQPLSGKLPDPLSHHDIRRLQIRGVVQNFRLNSNGGSAAPGPAPNVPHTSQSATDVNRKCFSDEDCSGDFFCRYEGEQQWQDAASRRLSGTCAAPPKRNSDYLPEPVPYHPDQHRHRLEAYGMSPTYPSSQYPSSYPGQPGYYMPDVPYSNHPGSRMGYAGSTLQYPDTTRYGSTYSTLTQPFFNNNSSNSFLPPNPYDPGFAYQLPPASSAAITSASSLPQPPPFSPFALPAWLTPSMAAGLGAPSGISPLSLPSMRQTFAMLPPQVNKPLLANNLMSEVGAVMARPMIICTGHKFVNPLGDPIQLAALQQSGQLASMSQQDLLTVKIAAWEGVDNQLFKIIDPRMPNASPLSAKDYTTNFTQALHALDTALRGGLYGQQNSAPSPRGDIQLQGISGEIFAATGGVKLEDFFSYLQGSSNTENLEKEENVTGSLLHGLQITNSENLPVIQVQPLYAMSHGISNKLSGGVNDGSFEYLCDNDLSAQSASLGAAIDGRTTESFQQPFSNQRSTSFNTFAYSQFPQQNLMKRGPSHSSKKIMFRITVFDGLHATTNICPATVVCGIAPTTTGSMGQCPPAIFPPAPPQAPVSAPFPTQTPPPFLQQPPFNPMYINAPPHMSLPQQYHPQYYPPYGAMQPGFARMLTAMRDDVFRVECLAPTTVVPFSPYRVAIRLQSSSNLQQPDNLTERDAIFRVIYPRNATLKGGVPNFQITYISSSDGLGFTNTEKNTYEFDCSPHGAGVVTSRVDVVIAATGSTAGLSLVCPATFVCSS